MVRRGFSSLAHHKAAAGFSLVELMLTLVFVTLGSMMIQGTMLRAADVYGRYTNTLKASLWATEQIERAREGVLRDDLELSTSGTLETPNKEFTWVQDYSGLDTSNLYSIDLNISWSEGGKPLNLKKTAYVYQKDLLQGF